MIKLIDAFSYSNKLRSVSPLWKCGFAVFLFLLSYISHPAVQLLTVSWMGVWTVGYARIPVRFYVGLFGASCLFYAVSLPALVIEAVSAADGTGVGFADARAAVLFSLFDWTVYISQNGLLTAVHLFCRIAACFSCLAFIMLTTPMSELFQVMKLIRIPSLVLEIMLIMYRFLFLLETTAHDIYTAQKSRGGHVGFRSKLNDTAVLIVRLFTKTMERYKLVSNGLIARGFTDEILMAPYKANSVPLRYKGECFIGIFLLIIFEMWLRWRDIL